jgi:hypothetical protein
VTGDVLYTGASSAKLLRTKTRWRVAFRAKW